MLHHPSRISPVGFLLGRRFSITMRSVAARTIRKVFAALAQLMEAAPEEVSSGETLELVIWRQLALLWDCRSWPYSLRFYSALAI